MYKKVIESNFEKGGINIFKPNIEYKNISMGYITITGKRENYCNIKNSPIFYYVIKGKGKFKIDNDFRVSEGDLIEIPANKKYVYEGNMKLLEIVPKNFEDLDFEEEVYKE